MSEESKRILQLLADGKVSVDEAERLLAALGQSGTQSPSDPDKAPPKKPKYLRVVVDAEDGDEKGPAKVNIRVPMQLLRAGVKLGTLIPPHARDKVNEAMHQHGVEFDLNQLKPENVEELIEQLNDLTVDVDQGRNKVRVFCE
jgi:hypothetical protein